MNAETAESLRAEIARLRAGEEGPGSEGVRKTAGQILRKLHELDEKPRMVFLGSLLKSAHAGSDCETQDHVGSLKYAGDQMEAIAKRERDAHRSLRLISIYVETLCKNPGESIERGVVAEKLALFLNDAPQPVDNRCRRVLCGYEWTEAGRTFQCAEPVTSDGGHLGEHYAYVREGSAADEELRMQYLEQENAEMRRRLGLERRG
ncbi:hypothetical protein SEA_SATIS_33 [Streptomyces phage Satis]|nr:hypothetical protein SEA_SATIS_33 [Streptomyces phage Satis]QBZ71932.1 hypothetical protein SEA_KRADAL_33 [Streptomyces phage Kradal]QPL14350.1 hypothetical protein SEA_EHYELIMAYOE_33 [Streptomyces phage EhyElimayoE]